jgi:hypothetical protein
MTINGRKYMKWHLNVPNGHKISQHPSLQDTPKFTQIWIFCMKIYHLATLPNLVTLFLADALRNQDCQMVYVCSFIPKNPTLGIFWVLSIEKCLYILWLLGKFYSHLLYFGGILVYFFRFGRFYQEKSGNPVRNHLKRPRNVCLILSDVLPPPRNGATINRLKS